LYNIGGAVDVANREILVELAAGDSLTVDFTGTGSAQIRAVFCVSSLVIIK